MPPKVKPGLFGRSVKKTQDPVEDAIRRHIVRRFGRDDRRAANDVLLSDSWRRAMVKPQNATEEKIAAFGKHVVAKIPKKERWLDLLQGFDGSVSPPQYESLGRHLNTVSKDKRSEIVRYLLPTLIRNRPSDAESIGKIFQIADKEILEGLDKGVRFSTIKHALPAHLKATQDPERISKVWGVIKGDILPRYSKSTYGGGLALEGALKDYLRHDPSPDQIKRMWDLLHDEVIANSHEEDRELALHEIKDAIDAFANPDEFRRRWKEVREGSKLIRGELKPDSKMLSTHMIHGHSKEEVKEIWDGVNKLVSKIPEHRRYEFISSNDLLPQMISKGPKPQDLDHLSKAIEERGYRTLYAKAICALPSHRWKKFLSGEGISRSPIIKSGPRLEVHGGARMGLINRTIGPIALKSWFRAERAGIPVEPILREKTRKRGLQRPRVSKLKDGNYSVFTRYAGPSIPEALRTEKFIPHREDIIDQMETIKRRMREESIHHGHDHPYNFVVEMEHGRPKVRVIDFDLAHSLKDIRRP